MRCCVIWLLSLVVMFGLDGLYVSLVAMLCYSLGWYVWLFHWLVCCVWMVSSCSSFFRVHFDTPYYIIWISLVRMLVVTYVSVYDTYVSVGIWVESGTVCGKGSPHKGPG